MTIDLIGMRSVESLFQQLDWLAACVSPIRTGSNNNWVRSGWRRYVTGRIFHISPYVLYPGPAYLMQYALVHEYEANGKYHTSRLDSFIMI